MATSQTLTLTDPVYIESKPGMIQRFFLRFLQDKRDWPFIKLMAQIAIFIIPFAAYFFIVEEFYWWVAAIYLSLNFIVFLGPFILMLHNTSHNRLFKRKYNWANQIVPWVLGPFFGESPETYFAHHVGMHHSEGNMPGDLSSTMKYNRDNYFHFLRYFTRFFFGAFFELAFYLFKKNRRKLFRKMVFGELSFYALCAVTLWFNWQASLVVFVIPFVFTRYMMMAGNWSQHAFIDAADPGNDYKSSICCINSTYNKRCFNDGYHIGHHAKATRHWTEMPEDFMACKEKYIESKSVIFEKLDYFMIHILLMTRSYKTLAKFFVNLDEENKLSRDEIVALLKQRTRRVVV